MPYAHAPCFSTLLLPLPRRIRPLQPHAIPQLAVLHPLLVRLLDVPARVDGGDARGGGRLLQAIHGLADQTAHLAETYAETRLGQAFSQLALQRPLSAPEHASLRLPNMLWPPRQPQSRQPAALAGLDNSFRTDPASQSGQAPAGARFDMDRD